MFLRPKFHLARHVTSRHDTLSSPCILSQEKVAMWCVALVGQNGATRASRQARQARLARYVFRGVATTWTVVDMSTSLFSRSFSWHWCKSKAKKTKLVHASTTASSSSAMLEQARCDTHDKWRDKWNLDLAANTEIGLQRTCRDRTLLNVFWSLRWIFIVSLRL